MKPSLAIIALASCSLLFTMRASGGTPVPDARQSTGYAFSMQFEGQRLAGLMRLEESGKKSFIDSFVPYSDKRYSLTHRACVLESEMVDALDTGKVPGPLAESMLIESFEIQRQLIVLRAEFVQQLRKRFTAVQVATFLHDEELGLRFRICRPHEKRMP